MAGVVSGLAHAHERDIIHHDLKPRHVLLTDTGPRADGLRHSPGLRYDPRDAPGLLAGGDDVLLPAAAAGREDHTEERRLLAQRHPLPSGGGPSPFSDNPKEIANQHIHKLPVPPQERGARIGKGFEILTLNCLAKTLPSDRALPTYKRRS